MKLKKAEPGSVSSGTLRTEDLLKAFADKLQECVSMNTEFWEATSMGMARRDFYTSSINDARTVDPEQDPASEVLEEMCDCLQDFAPAGHVFGTHPGDGADYGFWPIEDY